MEVQVPTDVAEADAQEGGSAQRAVAHPLQDPHAQAGGVAPELRRVPGGGGPGDQLLHVGVGGLVRPVQDHELGGEVQHLELTAPQVHHLGGRGVPALDDQRQPDVLDTTPGPVHLVEGAVLDHGAGERELADPGDVPHGLGPRVDVHARIHRASRTGVRPP